MEGRTATARSRTPEDRSAQNRADGQLVDVRPPGYGRRMSPATSLLVADTEPETQRFLTRQLPQDGFRLVGAQAASRSRARRRRRERRALGGASTGDRARPRTGRRGRPHPCLPSAVATTTSSPPFEYQELVERIRAVLRRVRPPAPAVVDAPPVRIDTRTRDVARRRATRPALAEGVRPPPAAGARARPRVHEGGAAARRLGLSRARPDAHARFACVDASAASCATPGGEVALVDNVWGVGYRLRGAMTEE